MHGSHAEMQVDNPGAAAQAAPQWSTPTRTEEMKMVTIKQVQSEARQVRNQANAQIKDLRERIKAIQVERDAFLAQCKAKIEAIREARKAKVVTAKVDKAERSAAWAAKREAAEERKAKAAVEFLLKYKAKIEARRPQLTLVAAE